jgi:hypothetical protein
MLSAAVFAALCEDGDQGDDVHAANDTQMPY